MWPPIITAPPSQDAPPRSNKNEEGYEVEGLPYPKAETPGWQPGAEPGAPIKDHIYVMHPCTTIVDDCRRLHRGCQKNGAGA